MKTNRFISTSLLAVLFLVLSAGVNAQDPLKAAANVYKKVLIDNDRVRVMEIEFAPGETAGWHHHPDHVAYALTDGKLEITDRGKAPITAELKAGEAIYLPSVTHMAKNVGTTSLKVVVTELKPAQAKRMSDGGGNKEKK